MASLFLSALVVVLVALLIVIVAERFSPDATLTWIVKAVVFVAVLYWLVTKLLPLVH